MRNGTCETGPDEELLTLLNSGQRTGSRMTIAYIDDRDQLVREILVLAMEAAVGAANRLLAKNNIRGVVLGGD